MSTPHPIVRSVTAFWWDGGDLLHVLGLGTPESMRDTACYLTSDIDGWRMFFVWDGCAFEGGLQVLLLGDTCSGLTSSLYLTGDLTAGVEGWGRVAGSGGIVSSSLLALAGARVNLFSPCLRGSTRSWDGEGL